MNAHPAADRLEAFSLGRLAEDELLTIERHLEACAPCCSLLEGVGEDQFVVRLRDSAGRTVPIHAGGDAPPRLPGYEILTEVGRGGMGVVYKARQLSLGREVALKVLIAGAYAGADDRRRFRAEAEALGQLRHPAIVQVHDSGDSAGLPFLVMEFVEGGTLADRLRGGPMGPAEAAALLQTLAGGVAAAHARGIVHRDLKPANVLMGGEDGPKVTDFGLARWADNTPALTRTGVVAGTPAYMAPEQAKGKAEVGPGTDVYALGAILYECLTGRPPHQADSGIETLQLVLTRRPARPGRLRRGIPPALEAVCLKCLEKDPAKRYPSAAALADDLARFRAGQRTAARPRTRRWILAALLLAAGALGSGWYLTRPPAVVDPPAFAEAARRQAEAARDLGVPAEFTSPSGLAFRLIPAGECDLGSSDSDIAALTKAEPRLAATYALEKRRRVRIERPLYMAAREVTQAEAEEILGEPRGAFAGQGEAAVRAEGGDTTRLPAVLKAWRALELCNVLSDRDGLSPVYDLAATPTGVRQADGYRLPTGDEWEYAARSDSRHRYVGGPSYAALGPYAWVAANSGDRPHPVGQKRANGFGLYDTLGNEYEMCHDLEAGQEAHGAFAAGGPMPKLMQGRGSYWWGRNYEAHVAFREVRTIGSLDGAVRLVRWVPGE